jgi:hypothetical protein
MYTYIDRHSMEFTGVECIHPVHVVCDVAVFTYYLEIFSHFCEKYSKKTDKSLICFLPIIVYEHKLKLKELVCVFQSLAEAMAENKTLKILNVESNFISGESIVELMKAINKNQTLQELRVANQVQGYKLE